ncbi:hypothetical protein G432_02420 [Sphingomonas sp. MM-1]|uniref:DedA family protein n=1 Tax=Sphingomonas sp. MM-1 TaxID=745310 RepID=UPI0002C07257|nr:hypothetical protein G432_02420 [Sphingomonas sp. MM-1]
MFTAMTVEALIARYGLLAIFIGAGVEGETVVVTGGLLAHQGLLPLPGAMIAAALGSCLADQLFFAAGRRFRDRPRVRRLIARPAFARAFAMFERHPLAFVFGFRFLYGLRTVSPIAIGTSRLPARTFLLMNAIAAAIWGVVFTGIGYAFGQGIERLFGRLRTAEHVIAAVAGVAIILLAATWIARGLIGRRASQ